MKPASCHFLKKDLSWTTACFDSENAIISADTGLDFSLKISWKTYFPPRIELPAPYSGGRVFRIQKQGAMMLAENKNLNGDYSGGWYNDSYAAAAAIVSSLRQAGYQALFVGGFVRDALLEKAPGDIDVATSATPDEVAEIFPNAELVGAAFGVVNIRLKGVNTEVATLRKERSYMDGRHPEEVSYTDDPAQDAVRRDFTINGMFFDPILVKIIDHVGGVDDVKAGILRTIGEPRERFREDYLRMFRAVRFATKLGFEIEEATAEAISTLAGLTAGLAPERVRLELQAMFSGPDPERALRLLSELGLLDAVLPEVAALRGIRQPEEFHPEGDVFEHTAQMLGHAAAITPELAWAVLTHDIGKPDCLTVDDSGGVHFYGHDQRGAVITEKILKRLRAPRQLIETITEATANHMRFAHITMMRPAKIRRLMANPGFALELELHRLDCLCSNGITENFVFLLDELARINNQPALPKSLISGYDVMSLGVPPGPKVGRMLRAVVDAQLEGRVSSRGAAIALVHCILDEENQPGNNAGQPPSR